MAAHAETSRISWLAASLGTQRQRVADLLARIADIGHARFEKPALFQKFANLMDQVACAKEEEVCILSEIVAIEQKHRFNRKLGTLKHPKPANDQNTEFRNERECDYDEEYENYCDEYGLHDDGEEGVYEYPEVIGPPGESYTQTPSYTPVNIGGVWMMPLASNVSASPKRPSRTLLWLLVLWMLLSGNGAKKNQGLNAD